MARATKAAVLVGINYKGSARELQGCDLDVIILHDLLTGSHGFASANCTILTDEATGIAGAGAYGRPTRERILRALSAMVDGACAGDSLFFSFSGRGEIALDESGDEPDGWDEALVPADDADGEEGAGGNIVDDELYSIAARVPAGARLFVLLDACLSGSAMDLRWQYDPKSDGIHVFDNVQHTGKPRRRDLLAGASIALAAGSVQSAATAASRAVFRKRRKNTERPPISGHVVCFSGCKDLRLSQIEPGGTGSELSHAFREILVTHGEVTYADMLLGLRKKLLPVFGQTPQMSSSHEFDLGSTNITF